MNRPIPSAWHVAIVCTLALPQALLRLTGCSPASVPTARSATLTDAASPVVATADSFLRREPIPITRSVSERSAGGNRSRDVSSKSVRDAAGCTISSGWNPSCLTGSVCCPASC